MYHHFIGVSALAVDYNVKVRNTRYDGFAAGAGLTFGYVAPISNRWTIDAHAGIGIGFVSSKEKQQMDNQT